jgi:hypothetical protein
MSAIGFSILLFGPALLLVGAMGAGEAIAERIDRHKTWKEIDRRSAMRRHPSWQVALFDQDAEGGL